MPRDESPIVVTDPGGGLFGNPIVPPIIITDPQGPIRPPVVVPQTPEILPIPGLTGTVNPVFASSILGVWRFNQTLEDSVNQNDFTTSTGSASYSNFSKFELIRNRVESRYGLKFETDKYYLITPTYSYDSNFTLAFWYYSPNPVGFTRHFQTRELEPKIAPIIAKCNSQQTGSQTTLSQSSFVVTEIADSKSKNAIRVFLTSNGTEVSHIITSEAYDAPGLHHILITYIINEKRFRIDIDGKPGILYSAPTTSLEQSGDFSINNVVPGFLAHKTTQTGAYIFDVVFSTYASRDNESLKAFRYGYEHISFADLFDTRFSYFGMSYAQPNTISTTHLFVDGGNIFAARSDGSIVQGVKPVWDREFNYQDDESISLLNVSNINAVERVSEGLKVKGTSVKI